MPPVILRSDQGRTITVDEGEAQYWINQGFQPSSVGAVVAETQAPVKDQGFAGTVRAAVTGGLSGATLGLSDVLLGSLSSDNERQKLLEARRQNPTVSGIAEFAGNVVPGVLSGGASALGRAAALTPAGAVSKLGQGIAATGAGAGLVGKTAALAAGGAVEGAAALGGSYLAQTALEDKPLSAEAFVGAMGGGALFGGVAGGALGIGSHVLARARSLFPKSQITRESAQAVEREAADSIRGALDDGRAMQDVVGREVEAMKLQAAEERLAAGAVPDSTLVDEVAPGRLNWALDRAGQQAARRPRRAFEPAELVGEATPGAATVPGRRIGAAAEPAIQAPELAAPPPALADLAAPSPVLRTADRAVFDLAPPGAPLRRTVPWQEIEAGKVAPAPGAADAAVATAVGRRPARAAGGLEEAAAPAPAQALEATRAGRAARPAVADEILAPPAGQVDIDEALRRVARAGKLDIAPALEPVVPRGMTGRVPAAGSLEDQLQAMARQAEAGVPLGQMRAAAADVVAPPVAMIDDAERIAMRDAWHGNLTPKEQEALKIYISSVYKDVNKGLRSDWVTGGREKLIEQIDAALAKSPTPRAMRLFRGLSGDEAKEMFGRLKPGDQFIDRAYSSASADPQAWVRDVNLVIDVPEGYQAGAMQKFETSEAGKGMIDEKEILLRRGARYEVVSKDGDRIHVRLVPDGGPAPLPEEFISKPGEWKKQVQKQFEVVPAAERAPSGQPPGAAPEAPVSPLGPAIETPSSAVDEAVAAAVPPRAAVADLAEDVLVRSNPKAAKIIDAARKEAAARAEVEAMFHRPAGEAAETAVGRRTPPAEAPRPGSGTVPWREIEAAKARGELPIPAAPASQAPPIPDFDALAARAGKDGVVQEAAAEEIAKRGWYDAAGVRARKAFKEDVWGTPGDANLNPEKLEKARKLVRSTKGGRDIYDVSVTPDGHLVLQVGTKPEEFAAMLELGGNLKVRWRPWLEWANEGAPKAADVLKPLEGLDLPASFYKAENVGDMQAALGLGKGGSLREAIDQGRGGAALGLADGSGRAELADQILGGARAAGGDINDQIATALGRRVGNMVPMGADIAEAARKINAHEEALAELAEALGERAPAAAVTRAAKFRAAQAAHADAAAGAQAHAAQKIDDNLHTVVEEVNAARVNAALDADAAKMARAAARDGAGAGADAAAGGAARQLNAAADIGAGLEVLKAMGVAVPDVERIPVIGPVLGMYLKARAALGIWKRAGGAVPQSLEGMIASKGAKTQDRVASAVSKMLEIGERGVRKVQPAAPAIGALAYRLFPGGEERASKSKDPVANYHARMDELARAAQPGAIERAVAERIPTADPALRDSFTIAIRRKLNYIDSVAPRPPLVPAMFQSDGGWRPSREKLESFGRTIAAAEDPAGVLEDVAAGRGVSIEAAKTLRAVYPGLYAKAQGMLAQAAPQLQGKLPYARTVSLRVLFDVPTDATTTPEHVRFLQQGSPAAASAVPAAAPAQGPSPAAPPTPSIAGPVSIGDRTMSRLDRRAGM